MTNQQMIDSINNLAQDSAKLTQLLQFAINNALLTMDTQHLQTICAALGIQTS